VRVNKAEGTGLPIHRHYIAIGLADFDFHPRLARNQISLRNLNAVGIVMIL